jgi:hypothetical protein
MESVWDREWYAGGFLWKWFHDPKSLSGRQKNRFCVHGKEAEKLVMRSYEKYRRSLKK